MICFLVIVTTSLAIRHYYAELNDAARELRTLDLLLAKDTGRALQSVTLLLDAVEDQLPRVGGDPQLAQADRDASEEMHRFLRDRVDSLPQLDAISIVSADGRLVNFSRSWPVPAIQLGDRDYFRHLRDHALAGPYLTEPVINRGTGTRTIYVSKRLNDPDGTFRGLLLGAVELGYFERFYESLHLEPGNFIALWRDDGALLASYPHRDAGLQAAVADVAPGEEGSMGVPGVSEKTWSFSGRTAPTRFVASEMVEGFPLHINIGRRKAVILKDWRREVLVIGCFVLVAIACILAVMWALIRRFRAYEAVNAAAHERERAILARQEVEEALRQAQKMEAVGRLTGGVAHDFNNLLTVIGSSVELLRRDSVSVDRRARYVEAIADASQRAAKLTGQLLAFARRQALKPEIFNVALNVAEVSQMLDRLTGPRIEVVTDLPPDPCHANADPNQFDTAIVNLAVNARDAMPGGGRLSIKVRQVAEMLDASATQNRAGSFVAVTVADNGTGIEPALRERVFEPFFTTKGVGQGTGLGLSQVIGFARQSGGDVSLVSSVGGGSAFTLFLPLAAADATPVRTKADFDSVSNGRGARILLVDDDPQVARLTAQLMRELRYFTVTAESGAEALLRLEEDEGGFDLVMSDVVMPGMDGVALAHAIRTLYPNLPILLTTGFSAAIADKGASGFALLHKPFGIEDLARELHRAISEARASQRGTATDAETEPAKNLV